MSEPRMVSPITGLPYTCQIHMDESVVHPIWGCSECLDDEHEEELKHFLHVYTR